MTQLQWAEPGKGLRTGQLSLAFLASPSPNSSLGPEAARRKSVTTGARVLPRSQSPVPHTVLRDQWHGPQGKGFCVSVLRFFGG